MTEHLSRKMLSGVLLLGLLAINTVLFMTLTSGRTASCGGGATLDAWIRIRMPSHSEFPTGYETCGVTNQYFSFNNLTYQDQWYMRVNVSHGSGNPMLVNNRYGNFPGASGWGIRVYSMSGCTDQAFVASSDCSLFPVKVKEGETNNLSVAVVSPCGYYYSGKRSQILFEQAISGFGSTPPNPIQIGVYAPSPASYSVNHNITCVTC